MDKRLQELMELDEAVDIICAACDKENDRRREKIAEDYDDKWNGMWDDIERDILPVREKIDISCLSYEYAPTTDLLGIHTCELKFYKNNRVYFDYCGGHERIERKSFPCLYNNLSGDRQERVKKLLDRWEFLYDEILNNFADLLEKQIKQKIKDKELETYELIRKAGE